MQTLAPSPYFPWLCTILPLAPISSWFCILIFGFRETVPNLPCFDITFQPVDYAEFVVHLVANILLVFILISSGASDLMCITYLVPPSLPLLFLLFILLFIQCSGLNAESCAYQPDCFTIDPYPQSHWVHFERLAVLHPAMELEPHDTSISGEEFALQFFRFVPYLFLLLFFVQKNLLSW